MRRVAIKKYATKSTAANCETQINAGIRAADSGIVNTETKKTFQTADAWLKEKLEQADVPDESTNGTA